MHSSIQLLLTPTTAPDLSWLGPTVTAVGALILGLITLGSSIWRRKQEHRDTVEEKSIDAQIAIIPKVTDGWEEVRKARDEATRYYHLYRAFENLYYGAIAALRHLVRDVRASHPEQEFDKDVLEAIAAVPPDTDSVH